MSDQPEDMIVEEENEDESVDVTYDIASYPSDYTLSGISEMWHQGDIIIPDYQREFVWSIKQSSLLVDSFLSGLPVPSVFFYIDEDNKNLVIDGQQRILSIVFFLEGYFGSENTRSKRQVFRLSGLGDKNARNGKRFVDLTDIEQRKLKQSVLRAINIRQLSPKSDGTSAYHIFERLNTGGTPLKPQEIRNCVFRGPLSGMLRDANKNTHWRTIIGRKTLDKHQKDVEMLLRVFALFENSASYEKPMKEFLNKAMKKNDSGETLKVEKFFNLLPTVMERTSDSLGEKPFNLRGPLNASALDSVMCVLFEDFDRIDFGNLGLKYKTLIGDEDFIRFTQLSTTDSKIVQDRIALVRKHLSR